MDDRRGMPLDPRRTAIVVVDFQNDYCHPEGAVASSQDFRLMERVIEPQVRLLEAATEAGLFVVFIRATLLPGHANESPARLREKQRAMPSYSIPTFDYVIEGTWGNDVMDELKQAAPNAICVFKDRTGGFVNTNLDLVLRSNGIDTVVLTGMATDGCVAATARGAEDYGYRCLFVRDCVATFKPDLGEHTLKVLASRMEVLDAADVLRLLSPAKVGARSQS